MNQPEDPTCSTMSDDLPAPSASVVAASNWLADAVGKDHGFKHGRTAFYWALVHVCQQHMKAEEAKK